MPERNKSETCLKLKMTKLTELKSCLYTQIWARKPDFSENLEMNQTDFRNASQWL